MTSTLTKAEVIYVTSASMSGAALYSRYLCESIWRKEFALHAIVPQDFDYLEEMRENNGSIFADLPPIRRKGLAGSIVLIIEHWYKMLKQMRWIAKNRIEGGHIVHFNFAAQGPFAVVPVVLAKIMGFRVIVTVHDINPNRFFLPGFMRRIELTLHDLSHTKADYLIVHFNRAKQIVSQEKGFDGERVVVIPHGRFTDEAGSPREIAEPDGPLNFLVFGSLRENKNIDIIAQAFLDAFDESDAAVLTIAGYPASPSLQATLEKLAARSAGRVQLIARWIEDEEAHVLFKKADCAVLAYAETFQSASGVAALSLSSGVALIATSVGDIGEIPAPERMAILMADASPEELKQALRTAFELGRQALHRMGEEGRNYADEHLSWDAIADRHIALYDRVAKQ